MSLGVLNNIAAIYAQNNLNNTQNSLQNTLTQLSSGSRINSGADDAAGLAVADGLHANEAALTQSTQNASDGIGLLQTADGALSQVTNLLNRAVTLSTEAANGTLTTSQAGSANQEYQNILSEIGNIGSTTNFNSNSVFSNTAKTVFVSDGTSSGSTSFSAVVGALSSSSVGLTAAGATTSLTGSAPTTSGSPTQSTSTLTFTSGLSTASGTLSLGLGSGAQHSITISALTSLSALATQINSDSTFSAEGISASVAGGVVTLKGPSSGASTLTIGTGTVTDSLATTVTPSAPSAGSTGASTTTFTLGAATDTFSGQIGIAVGTGSAHLLTVAAGTSGTALATAINADTTYAAAGVTAAFNATTGVLTVAGPTGAGNTLNVSSSALKDTPALGAGVDFTAAGVSSLTAGTASAVLTSVTSAISDVAYQRGIIGADINQLTAASQVASSESENLTAAESSIRSTDYGQATSDLAKYKVLSETGISALAQANSVQQEVTKLLQ